MRERYELTKSEAEQILGAVVARVDRLESAGASDVFAVTTEAGAGAVVKLAAEPWAWRGAKEAHVYALIGDDPGLPTPRVLGYDASKAVVPRGVLVLERLPGAGAASLADTGALYRQLGVLLARLHRVELDAFGYIGAAGVVERHETNGDYMRALFERKLHDLVELGGDAAIAQRLGARAADEAELFDGCTRAVLCHDDGHEGNVLVEHGRICGLVDFENAVAGDQLLDLAKVLAYTRRPQETVRAALLEGYGAVRERLGETLELYDLFHRLELWTFLASIGATEHLAGIAADIRSRL